MEKPTIFFSHSSQDRDLILPIKNKLSNITSNVINIFMSSDGQSIPFGNNWVHKIEEGLRNSKIMFVFITQNSINNAWVYFESGYAYSKEIEVIPVGIGVNVGELKPPLNLLQGFNVTSGDSLNNFVSVINQSFDLNFKDDFSEEDYKYIKLINLQEEYDISSIFKSANYSTYSQYNESDTKNLLRYNLEKAVENYKSILNEKGIEYSINTPDERTLLVNGIQIHRTGDEVEPREYMQELQAEQNHKLSTIISTRNFSTSFELFKEMSDSNKHLPSLSHLIFILNDGYSFISSPIELSSILNMNPDLFSLRSDSVGLFEFKKRIIFRISNQTEAHFERYIKKTEYALFINFEKSNEQIKDILELISELVDLNIIIKKSGSE